MTAAFPALTVADPDQRVWGLRVAIVVMTKRADATPEGTVAHVSVGCNEVARPMLPSTTSPRNTGALGPVVGCTERIGSDVGSHSGNEVLAAPATAGLTATSEDPATMTESEMAAHQRLDDLFMMIQPSCGATRAQEMLLGEGGVS